MEVFEKVSEIISNILGCETEDISKELTKDDLYNYLGADSLDTTEILMEVEHHYHISIKDDIALSCETIGEFVELIESLI